MAAAPHRRYTADMKLQQIGCLLAILAATSSVQAQWQWLDKDGRKVFSDRPPPADVLEKNVLKRPAVAAKAVPALSGDAAPDEANGPAPVAKSSGEDKQLLARKKQLADAEAAKQKVEAERIAKLRAESCARARQGKTTYQSGTRISRTTANGEREVLDDAAIASELRHIQEVIDSDCK